jgi:H+/Cl- antiporter ClcA
LETIKTPLFVLLCLFVLTISTADLILGLGLAAYWVALIMPGPLIVSIFETYSRYYIVFAIFALLGAIAGFVGVFYACWKKLLK